jgi:hypothetical protein
MNAPSKPNGGASPEQNVLPVQSGGYLLVNLVVACVSLRPSQNRPRVVLGL